MSDDDRNIIVFASTTGAVVIRIGDGQNMSVEAHLETEGVEELIAALFEKAAEARTIRSRPH